MFDNDPHRIGSPAWQEIHVGAEPATPMTVTSAHSQLDQPALQPAPQTPALESEAHAELLRIARDYNEHLDRVDHDAIDPLTGQIELDAKLKSAHADFDARGIDSIVSRVDTNVAEKKQRREQLRKSLVKEGDQAAETQRHKTLGFRPGPA